MTGRSPLGDQAQRSSRCVEIVEYAQRLGRHVQHCQCNIPLNARTAQHLYICAMCYNVLPARILPVDFMCSDALACMCLHPVLALPC